MQALDLFFWLCALGMAAVIPLTLAKKRKALLGWFGAYLLIYSYFSMNGQYIAKNATSQSKHWMPLHCQSSQTSKSSLNALGAFFLPCVWGDRLVVHRTQKPPSPPRIPAAT